MFELDQIKGNSNSPTILNKINQTTEDSKVPGKEQDPDLHHFSELLLEENEGLRKQIFNLEESNRIIKE